MAKREATSELNHENWNEEEESEEAGHFKTASAEQLKERKFIKPKRRLAQASTSSGASSENPFTGFSSFAAVAAAGTAKPFETFTFGNVSSAGTNNDSSNEAQSPISVPEPSPPASVNIFGGSSGNSPTTAEPAKFSFATGLPFTPPEKSSSSVTTTTPSWKFGIDSNEDTEPDSTNDKSNEEVVNLTDSTTEASVESDRDRDSTNDVPVSESDKSSELTNTSSHNNEVGPAEDEEEENDNEPDSTDQPDEESVSKD